MSKLDRSKLLSEQASAHNKAFPYQSKKEYQDNVTKVFITLVVYLYPSYSLIHGLLKYTAGYIVDYLFAEKRVNKMPQNVHTGICYPQALKSSVLLCVLCVFLVISVFLYS